MQYLCGESLISYSHRLKIIVSRQKSQNLMNVGTFLFSIIQIEYSLNKFYNFYLKRKVDNYFDTSQKRNIDYNFETKRVLLSITY